MKQGHGSKKYYEKSKKGNDPKSVRLFTAITQKRARMSSREIHRQVQVSRN